MLVKKVFTLLNIVGEQGIYVANKCDGVIERRRPCMCIFLAFQIKLIIWN